MAKGYWIPHLDVSNPEGFQAYRTMADAAHELRTPLTALYLQMGMLAHARGEAEREAAMGTLSAGVQRAMRLVEQMLALARQGPRAESPPVPVR